MKKVLLVTILFFAFISCSQKKKNVLINSVSSDKNIEWIYSSGHYVVGLDVPSLEPELIVYFDTVVDQPYVFGGTVAVPVSGKTKKGFEKKMVFMDLKGNTEEVTETVPDVFQILPCGEYLLCASYSMTLQGNTGFSVLDSESGKLLANENSLGGLLAMSGNPYFFDENTVLLVTSPTFEDEDNKISFWSYDLSKFKLEQLDYFDESIYSEKAYSDSFVWENLLVLFSCDMNYISIYSLPYGKIIRTIDLKSEVFENKMKLHGGNLDAFNMYCVSRDPFISGNDLCFLCFFCGPFEEEKNILDSHFQTVIKIDRESLSVKEILPLDSSFGFSNAPFETRVLFDKVLALRWDNTIAGFDLNSGNNIFYKEIELK